MVGACRVEDFRLATSPLAMNRNDYRELTENDRRECKAAEQHVHRELL